MITVMICLLYKGKSIVLWPFMFMDIFGMILTAIVAVSSCGACYENKTNINS